VFVRLSIVAAFLTVLAALAACTAVENDLNKGLSYGTNAERLTRKADAGRKPGQLPSGVNAYLWRAALDTVGFFPLTKADAKAGRIVTDWYSPPSSPDERTQLTVEVLDPDLRRDTVRVSVARQVRQDGGAWAEAATPALTAQTLEETIFAKAHELRGW
jgi:Domain of unknown function (DUF3576)